MKGGLGAPQRLMCDAMRLTLLDDLVSTISENEPARFISNPRHQNLGSNT